MLPDDIPANPNQTYKDKGWKGMGDWLGTGAIAPRLRVYRPFEEAREYIIGLGLRNNEEWRKYCKGLLSEKGVLPTDIPMTPRQTYKNQGWQGMGDWLGTGNVANFLREYLPFEEAREFARGLGLKNRHEWRKFCKGLLPEKGLRPNDIPANPNQTYKNEGWKGFGDWLGTGNVFPFIHEYLPFEEAREFARGLELRNQKEWFKFRKGELLVKGTLPSDIPANPNRTYETQGWKGWGDWLGKE